MTLLVLAVVLTLLGIAVYVFAMLGIQSMQQSEKLGVLSGLMGIGVAAGLIYVSYAILIIASIVWVTVLIRWLISVWG